MIIIIIQNPFHLISEFGIVEVYPRLVMSGKKRRVFFPGSHRYKRTEYIDNTAGKG